MSGKGFSLLGQSLRSRESCLSSHADVALRTDWRPRIHRNRHL